MSALAMSDAHANPLSSADLAAFVAAFEAGSVHGAADALDLTQSAVTKRLQSLERRAGVRLFDRGRFGTQPTPAGRLLYPEAKQSLAALAQAADVLAEHRVLVDHALGLAASHTIGEFLLPGWLAAFRGEEEPGFRAQIEIVNSPGVLGALREQRAHIGFVEGLDQLDGFEALTVRRDALVVVVAAGHPWARRRTILSAQLAREQYLTREPGSGTRAVVNDALGRAGIGLEPTLETASLQSVKRALLSGGFSILSPLAIESEERSGTLRAVALADVALERELRAVRRRSDRLTGVARRFWTWLTALAIREGA
jgi:DNA-binding transcriptional LysR family regulator